MSTFNDAGVNREFLKDGINPNINSGVEITWKNITLAVSEKKTKDKIILDNISGIAEPGELLAIMGPSGSGKTSLLKILAGRNTDLESGTVLLNSNPINKQLRRKISFVLQEDLFFEHLTLMETLIFTAKVRLSNSMSLPEKRKYIEEIVDILDIKKCLDTKIGDLSGGEKKRANIACELMINPDILLLDEPTTGLDSSLALSLIRCLANYAKSAQKTVLTTIHQPSSQIFYMFNHLMLLLDGQVVYFGAIQNVVEYFEKIDLYCPLHYNPADFFMEKLRGSKDEIFILKEKARSNFRGAILPKRKSQIVKKSIGKNANDLLKSDDIDLSRKWPTNFSEQYLALVERQFKQSKKTLLVNSTLLIQNGLIALVVALCWFQIPFTEEHLFNRTSLNFFLMVYWMFTTIFSVLFSFPSEKTVLNKERSSGYYRLSAYYIGKITSEVPLLLVFPFLSISLIFWMAGLGGPLEYVVLLAIYIPFCIASQFIGYLIGAACMDFDSAKTLGVVAGLILMLTSGFLIETLPIWLDWTKYLFPVYYMFSGTLMILFSPSNQPISCADDSIFPECTNNQTLYISNKSILDYNQIYIPLWIDFLVIIGYNFILFPITYFVLRLRKPEI